MKAVILVGGEGTRLRPLTHGMPKSMVPVLNRPFLEHTLAHLRQHGVDEVILAVGYLPQVIQAHFGAGEGTGVRLRYALEPRPLGTAGAVKRAAAHLDRTFAVLNGDIFSDLDLGAMLSFHQSRQAQATIALTRVEDPSAFGVVETGPGGRVQRFIEKPHREEATTNWINAGVYILEPEALAQAPPDTHYMFERGLFPLLLEQGEPVYGYPFSGYWVDMGTPQKYLQLNCDLLQGQAQSFLVPWEGNEVRLGKGVVVPPGAELRGPCLIGDGCKLERGVRIWGPAVLGPGCHLGPEAMVEATVLWEGVTAGRGASLTRCVVGSHTQVQAQARLHDCALAGKPAAGGRSVTAAATPP
ncbi:MAG: NDP-sugar synthase [Chloroflexi bacterium]|nr:NDP-sugar synthase [Chloroflexota bacterium]MBI4216058.1 NDP-sugar synthase [Chloroflexota bacterium]